MKKTKDKFINELKTFRARFEALETKEIDPSTEFNEVIFRFLEAMSDGFMLVDMKGTFIFVNQAMENISGYRKKEIIGRSFFEFIPEVTRADEYEKMMEVLQFTFLQGITPPFEYTHIARGGREVPVSCNASFFRDEQGHPTALVVVCRDITHRKRMEDALRRSEERYRTLVKTSPDTTTIVDLKGIILEVSQKTLDQFGCASPEEMTGSSIYGFIDPKDHEKTRDDLQETLEKEFKGNFEYTFCRKDGTRFIGDVNAALVKGPSGARQAIICTVRDITQRVEANRVLRENEERFRALFDGSLDAVFLTDPDTGEILDANPFASDLLLTSHEKIVGLNYSDLLPPRLREEARKRFNEYALDKGSLEPVEMVVQRSDGSERHVEALGQVIQIDGRPVLHGVFRDITERRKTEEARRESEAKFRSLAEQSPNMIFINTKGRVVYVNDMCEEVMGYTKEEFYSPDFDFLCLVAPESRNLARATFKRHMNREEAPPHEYNLITKNGGKMVAILAIKLIPYEGEQAILGTITDITARKIAEEALRESEEMYRTLVRTSPDAVTVTDLEGRISEVSQQTLELHGSQTPEEMIGKNAVELIHPKDHERAMKNLAKVLKEGRIRSVEYTLLKEDGTSFLGEMNASVVKDAHGNPKSFIASIRDVTRRKQVEAELANAQKLESLGVLAGGIAHDFNNILSAISTNLSMARMFGDIKDDVDKMLTDAETATLRAQNLTHQLLTFSKGGSPVKRTISIQRLLQETVDFALSGSNVRCDDSVPGDLWPVDVDEGQISQAIHNLILNADQAMPEGGMIRIGGENLVLAEGSLPSLKEGCYIKISVTDQGIGIPEKHLHKIFDPFFSTKYKGSGLGLATCFSIVTKHDGHIHVDSEAGVGTTFSIYLPSSKQTPATQKKTKKKKLQGQGKILLVDDEAIVRKATGKALEKMGYDVDFAAEGAEGIRIYREAREAGEPFDAVIMDLTIPGGMGGQKAIRKLLEVDPQARALVSSGYANNPVMSDFRKYGFSGVVKKPYRIHDLAEALRKIMK